MTIQQMIAEFFAWIVQQQGPVQIELGFPEPPRRRRRGVTYRRLQTDDLRALLEEYGTLRTAADDHGMAE